MFRLRTPWRGVAAMFVLNGALFGIWASRIPTVAETHALGAGALGALLLLMALGAIASFALAGQAADRFGALVVTRWVAIAYVLALVLIALAPNTPLLALAAAVLWRDPRGDGCGDEHMGGRGGKAHGAACHVVIPCDV